MGQHDPAGFGGQFGYYTDSETGLALCQHRYYDSSVGRFLTRDPIGYAGGLNLYAYCANNPVSSADPTGFNPQSDGGDDLSLSPWQIFNPFQQQDVVNQAWRYAGEGEMSPWSALAITAAAGLIDVVSGEAIKRAAAGIKALGAGAKATNALNDAVEANAARNLARAASDNVAFAGMVAAGFPH